MCVGNIITPVFSIGHQLWKHIAKCLWRFVSPEKKKKKKTSEPFKAIGLYIYQVHGVMLLHLETAEQSPGQEIVL